MFKYGVRLILIACLILGLTSGSFAAVSHQGVFEFKASKLSYQSNGDELNINGYLFNATNSDVTGIYFIDIIVTDQTGNEIGKATFKAAEYNSLNLASGKTKAMSFTIKSPVKNKDLTKAVVKSNIGFNYKNTQSLKTDIKVSYKNQLITYDVLPRVEKGRTLIPARYTFEKMGCKVDWRQSDKTVLVTRDGISIEIQIDSKTMKVNGKSVTLEVPAQVIDNRTLVPLRAISEAMGCFVLYGSDFRFVSIEE